MLVSGDGFGPCEDMAAAVSAALAFACCVHVRGVVLRVDRARLALRGCCFAVAPGLRDSWVRMGRGNCFACVAAVGVCVGSVSSLWVWWCSASPRRGFCDSVTEYRACGSLIAASADESDLEVFCLLSRRQAISSRVKRHAWCTSPSRIGLAVDCE